MSNQNELRRARQREAEAVQSRKSVEALPRKVGQRVRWPHNGVEWTRFGDDDWRADDDGADGYPYPSAHIASCPWVPAPVSGIADQRDGTE